MLTGRVGQSCARAGVTAAASAAAIQIILLVGMATPDSLNGSYGESAGTIVTPA
jgi:hypothetical protein